jgi:hypothetical protein
MPRPIRPEQGCPNKRQHGASPRPSRTSRKRAAKTPNTDGVPVGGEAGSYLYDWVAETIKALLPRIEQLGLASAQNLQIEILAQRIEHDAIQHSSELIGTLQFGAWAKKP